MNLNFLCCIGAELKNSVQQTTRMTQVYLYRAFEEETIADMLATGFFNDALGIIRQDDLLLLYSPNETPGKYVYARVSSVGRDGVEIEKVNIRAEEITVDTTGYTNLSGSNLQQILNNLDTLLTTMNNAFVKKDGTSIMSAPLKFVAGSLRGAIGPTFGGVEFYTLNNDSPTYSLVQLGRFTTSAFSPHTDNAYDIGTSARHWKDAYIGRVITSVLNNGFDIAVPVTNSADTLALKSEVDNAANSGRMITDQGVWYAKMYSASVVPTGAEYDGQNYADFSQVDGDNNPIIVIYEGQSGSWVETERVTPPANYDGYVPVTKKIWDIVEQTGQQGGRILWNHQSKAFTPYPNIVDLSNVADTDLDNLSATGEARFTGKANTDLDNLTSTGKNIANWSSNVSNCITEIPQDIKLELNAGVLTLKAGSKVYVPNGAGVFDEVVIANDLTTISTWGTQVQLGLFVKSDGSTMYIIDMADRCTSGPSAPTATNAQMWYDTTNNLMKRYASGSDTGDRYSLPIALVQKGDAVESSNISSIDQVFNGFGYIGSTVFALPGVKGLIPDGRNADGTLKNIPMQTTDVLVMSMNGYMANRINAPLVFTPTTLGGMEIDQNGLRYVSRLTDINPSAYTGWYCEEDNLFHYFDGSVVESIKQWVSIGKFAVDSNLKITKLDSRTAFHAVDYNDTECMTKGALSNIVNGADTKVGDVYYTSAPNNISVYAPSGGKWLVLYVTEVDINTGILYLFSADLKHKVGEVVDGGTQITQARSGYGAYVSLLKIS